MESGIVKHQICWYAKPVKTKHANVSNMYSHLKKYQSSTKELGPNMAIRGKERPHQVQPGNVPFNPATKLHSNSCEYTEHTGTKAVANYLHVY